MWWLKCIHWSWWIVLGALIRAWEGDKLEGMEIRITKDFSFMKFDPKEKERGTSQRGRFSSPSLLSLKHVCSMLKKEEKIKWHWVVSEELRINGFKSIAEDIIVVCPELTVSSFWGWKSAKGTDTVGKGLGSLVCNQQLCLSSRRQSWILRVNMVEVGCRLWNKAEKLRENSNLLLNEHQKHLSQCRFGEEGCRFATKYLLTFY